MCNTCGGDQSGEPKQENDKKDGEKCEVVENKSVASVKCDNKCDAKAAGDDVTTCDTRKCKSRELRMGVTYLTCECIKKNGLQDQCPRTCCHGSKLCMETPKPKCCPSVFPQRYINMTHGIRKFVDLNEKFHSYFYKF